MRAVVRNLLWMTSALLAGNQQAFAADYPEKSIRLVVPYGAGGGTDVVARTVAAELTKRLGQSMVVENRPGAESSIGSEIVARAAPDGYTLLVGASGLTSGPFVLKSFAIDPLKDLTHIVQFAEAPTLFVVNSQVPVKSMKEFIDLAKASPDKVNAAVFGPYVSDLAVLNAMAGTKIGSVPFPGGIGPMLAAVLGNHVQAMFTSQVAVKGHIAQGQLRVLGTGTARRHSLMPDVPAIAETIPGFTSSGLWQGLSGPVGLPENVIAKLNAETNAALKTEEIRASLERGGFAVAGGTPAVYRAWIVADLERFQRAAKLSGGGPK